MIRLTLTFVIVMALTSVPAAADDPATNLAQYMSDMEQLAHEQGEIALQKYGTGHFPEALARSLVFVEKGMYKEAAAVISALLHEEMARDWRTMLTTRLEILQKWADTNTIELQDYGRFYLDPGRAWFRDRAQPIVLLWELQGVDEADKYALLLQFLQKWQDRDGERLVLAAIAASKNSTSDAAAKALLAIGNRHHKVKEYDQAERAWLRVIEEFPASTSCAKAVFNLGLLHKHKGQFDRAIGYFSSLLNADVNDLEPGGHIMEAYRNYRPRSQWEIANCLFAQKKYRQALEAYRVTASKYPFQSWCGNAHAEYRYRYAFYQGLCHDWLGDPVTAVGLYHKAISVSHGFYANAAAHIRIVELYAAAGQVKDLEQLLDSTDQDYLAKVKQVLGGRNQRTDQEILQTSPTATMRRLLVIRTMAQNSDWEGLISLLKAKGTVAGPHEAYARRGNWEATQAAAILAQHTDQTVPLVVARLTRADAQDAKWLYYALGRCGTDEAIAALKKYALKETNSNWTDAVVYAVSLAGAKGDAALDGLAGQASGQLKGSITRYRRGFLGDQEKGIDFPELGNVPDLPKTAAGLRAVQPPDEADD